ncbi:hypothetical protein KSP39_PZI011668 [Platanthera zijinensis]|uniref:HAT C-terminal dimerisation domain-containing protein n=1 Tax=Platanthera zijinensis TaxID=2320716 RepID=A0AAP0G5S5_9ASPA
MGSRLCCVTGWRGCARGSWRLARGFQIPTSCRSSSSCLLCSAAIRQSPPSHLLTGHGRLLASKQALRDSVGDSTRLIMQNNDKTIERVIGDIDSIVNEVGNKASNDTLGTSSEIKDDNENLQKAKRLKKSSIWLGFTKDKDKDGLNCAAHRKAKAEKERSSHTQTQLGFVSSTVDPSSFPALHDEKVDIEVMKEFTANWILMHEDPFSIVEEEAQDSISEIKDTVNVIRDSVKYIQRSDDRFKIFSEIVKQLNLPERKLVDDCRTRWNSTYEMLAAACKFKDVFLRFAEQDPYYDSCPSEDDWVKIEKVCSVLEVFWTATDIISGSEYPTSNLFLNEGASNLLMSVAAVLDSRCKMRALEFFFPKLYFVQRAELEINLVNVTLQKIYAEYVENHMVEGEVSGEIEGSSHSNRQVQTQSDWFEYFDYVKSVESIQPQKSKLDIYLEENCYMIEKDLSRGERNFDVLEWWRVHALKYKILSTLAKDILAILITSVASEATFSAGSRVIDKYRASLKTDTVQV